MLFHKLSQGAIVRNKITVQVLRCLLCNAGPDITLSLGAALWVAWVTWSSVAVWSLESCAVQVSALLPKWKFQARVAWKGDIPLPWSSTSQLSPNFGQLLIQHWSHLLCTAEGWGELPGSQNDAIGHVTFSLTSELFLGSNLIILWFLSLSDITPVNTDSPFSLKSGPLGFPTCPEVTWQILRITFILQIMREEGKSLR